MVVPAGTASNWKGSRKGSSYANVGKGYGKGDGKEAGKGGGKKADTGGGGRKRERSWHEPTGTSAAERYSYR